MYKIKTVNKIDASGLSRLHAELFDCGDNIKNPDGIIVRSADMHSYDFAQNPELCAIARAGAGVNNIPLAKCSEAGIVVFNTPGANANAVCELVLCALFLTSRNIFGGIEWAKGLANGGDKVPALVEKGKSAFAGPEISGKTLGVIGLGAIGIRVANSAIKLGMNVFGYDPYISVESAWKLSRYVNHAKDLKTLYEKCDYITIHVPYMDSTKGMINESAISAMKSGVKILNFARGEIVSPDIIAALESGKVRCYITDFPDADLIKAKNVIPVPHLGASTPESEENCAVMAVDNLEDYLVNGNIKYSVNLPDVYMARSGLSRLAMVHKNIPNMLANILSILTEEKVNVENMINKSKGEYAYTILDLNSEVHTEALNKVRITNDMLRLRVI